MGNGAIKRKAYELIPSSGFTKVWSLSASVPDRYSKHKRFDKFRELPEAEHPVWSVAVAEVAQLLAASVADATVHIWDLVTCELKVTLRAHTAQVWAVEFSPSESTLATASADSTVRLWDSETGNPTGLLRGHVNSVRCLAFSKIQGLLLSGGIDANLCLWEFGNVKPIRKWKAHEGAVYDVAFSHTDTNVAFSVGKDGSVAVWNCLDGGEGMLSRFAGGDGGGVLCVAAHPLYLGCCACGIEDGGVWLWFFKPNAPRGESTVRGHNELHGHGQAVWTLQFSDDGCILASGSSDSNVRVWNVTDLFQPMLCAIFNAHESWVRHIRFRRGRKGLVTCSTDGTVTLWSVPLALSRLKIDFDKPHPFTEQGSVGVVPISALMAAVQQEEKQTGVVPISALMAPPATPGQGVVPMSALMAANQPGSGLQTPASQMSPSRSEMGQTPSGMSELHMSLGPTPVAQRGGGGFQPFSPSERRPQAKEIGQLPPSQAF